MPVCENLLICDTRPGLSKVPLTYRRCPFLWSCLWVRSVSGFVRAPSWRQRARSWWFGHLRLCRTCRTPPWTLTRETYTLEHAGVIQQWKQNQVNIHVVQTIITYMAVSGGLGIIEYMSLCLLKHLLQFCNSKTENAFFTVIVIYVQLLCDTISYVFIKCISNQNTGIFSPLICSSVMCSVWKRDISVYLMLYSEINFYSTVRLYISL